VIGRAGLPAVGAADQAEVGTVAAVEVRAVSKLYVSDAGRVLAVDNVSLEVAPRGFVSLVGPSGCGKSTLLRMIAGLTPPTSGEILVNGLTPLEARRHRQYGIVFQAPVLFDWRTVEQNVRLPLEIMGFPAQDAQRRAAEALRLVGLSEFGRHRPWQLSGGMQQRVAIARALSFEPGILLMDEPFGALDLITRDRMGAELLKIVEGATVSVVFVTHSIPEAVFLSDEVIIMTPRPARIADRLPVDLPRPRTEAVRTSQAFFELVAQASERLRSASD
jgi:NitT/TauT family transport system ATP-binding protein